MSNYDIKYLDDAVVSSRGLFIDSVTRMENAIDLYISKHFTTDIVKLEELMCLIIVPRVSLENKKQIFSYLIETYNTEFENKHPNYSSDFVEIIELRNQFAHYHYDNSQEALREYYEENSISLIKYKNTRYPSENKKSKGKVLLSNRRTMNNSYVNLWIKKITMYATEIGNLGNVITASPPTK